MATKHLVDAELVAALDLFPPLELSNEAVVQICAMQEEMRAQMAANQPAFPEIAVSERFVPGLIGAPSVQVLVHLPTTVPGLALDARGRLWNG